MDQIFHHISLKLSIFLLVPELSICLPKRNISMERLSIETGKKSQEFPHSQASTWRERIRIMRLCGKTKCSTPLESGMISSSFECEGFWNGLSEEHVLIENCPTNHAVRIERHSLRKSLKM